MTNDRSAPRITLCAAERVRTCCGCRSPSGRQDRSPSTRAMNAEPKRTVESQSGAWPGRRRIPTALPALGWSHVIQICHFSFVICHVSWSDFPSRANDRMKIGQRRRQMTDRLPVAPWLLVLPVAAARRAAVHGPQPFEARMLRTEKDRCRPRKAVRRPGRRRIPRPTLPALAVLSVRYRFVIFRLSSVTCH